MRKLLCLYHIFDIRGKKGVLSLTKKLVHAIIILRLEKGSPLEAFKREASKI